MPKKISSSVSSKGEVSVTITTQFCDMAILTVKMNVNVVGPW